MALAGCADYFLRPSNYQESMDRTSSRRPEELIVPGFQRSANQNVPHHHAKHPLPEPGSGSSSTAWPFENDNSEMVPLPHPTILSLHRRQLTDRILGSLMCQFPTFTQVLNILGGRRDRVRIR
ncbi:hypothetical protein FQN60_007724, partial [Etheostoma spectabile]